MPVELQKGVLPQEEPQEAPKRRGRPPGTKNKPKFEGLEKEITEKLTETVAVPIAFISPVAAAVLEQRKEKTAKALVRLAIKYPAFAKYLQVALEGTSAFDLALTVLAMIIGVSVDVGAMQYDSFPATAFGIDKIVIEIYGQPEESTNGEASGIARDRGLMGDI